MIERNINDIFSEQILSISKYHNVDINLDKIEKILKAKKMFNLGIYCPCCPDDRKRYCGSRKCMEEVKETGSCHCGLFVRKE